jgi:GT2 family glycosyltransferase
LRKPSNSELCNDQAYREWIAAVEEPATADDRIFCDLLDKIKVVPNFLFIPLFVKPIDPALIEPLETSLKAQVYGRWRLAAACSILEYESHTGAAAALKKSAYEEDIDFVVPLPADCILAPHALGALAIEVNANPDLKLIYSDEDFSFGGQRKRPWFKTGWDPFFALGRDLIGAFGCYRRSELASLDKPFRSKTLDNFLYELNLRVAVRLRREEIAHVPSILCHRTMSSDWRRDDTREVAQDFLSAKGHYNVKFSPAPLAPHWNRLQWPKPNPEPLLSVIIPTRDKASLLQRCVSSLLDKSNYKNLELIIVDNRTQEPAALRLLDHLSDDARVRVLPYDRPFNFSKLINAAATEAQGSLLLLLNNDTEILHEDCLDELASLALLPEVGAVGAKLLYPDLTIQHGGIGFGPENLVWHGLQNAGCDDSGPFGELALTRQVWAITAACLMVRREVFFQAGGLDDRFVVAYQDVDFCRRIAKKGYSILYTPHAQLLHFEAATRGAPDQSIAATEREFAEMALFWQKNPEDYDRWDPFFTPNATMTGAVARFARRPLRPPSWRRLCGKRLPQPFLY